MTKSLPTMTVIGNHMGIDLNPIILLPRLDTKYWFRRRRQIDYFRTKYDHLMDLLPRRVKRNELHVVATRPTVIELTVKCCQSPRRNQRVVVNVFQKVRDSTTGRRTALRSVRHVMVF